MNYKRHAMLPEKEQVAGDERHVQQKLQCGLRHEHPGERLRPVRDSLHHPPMRQACRAPHKNDTYYTRRKRKSYKKSRKKQLGNSQRDCQQYCGIEKKLLLRLCHL